MSEPNWRERWLLAAGAYDPHGRRQPRRVDLPDYLLMIARIDPARVRRVPKRAIADDGVDEDGDFALVTCPCGARPVVRFELAKCSDCERYYTLIAPGYVFLTYGEMTPPPLAADQSASPVALSPA